MFNPDKQIPWTKDESRCYFGTAPTLRQLNEVYGARTAETWLLAQIVNFSVFSGVRDQVTGMQTKELSELIYSNYFYLKISELLLFFRQLKEGRFGNQFYGTFNPIVITQALRSFIKQRDDAYYRHENNNDKVYDDYFRIMAKHISQQDYMNEMQQTTFTTDKD